MSRHVLVDRPDCRVVLGYDRPLRSFFGQRFDPSRDAGTAVAGWPGPSGLDAGRRPAATYLEAAHDLNLLIEWARRQQPADLWREPEASRHLDHLRHTLFDEWLHGCDHGSRKPPARLTGPLS